METSFSTNWKRSTQRTKQHKYNYNAPLHVKQKKIQVHLVATLRKKYGLRNMGVRKGDKVKIMRGQFANREGKVGKILLKKEKILVDGVETIKKDGTKVYYPLHPSNLLIMELDLADKKRKKKVERKRKHESASHLDRA